MPQNKESEKQPTVLPWHREAAEASGIETIAYEYLTIETLAAIIARHDPHATTLRLLEEAYQEMKIWNATSGDFGPLLISIRAHLAAHSKPDETKGSK